MDANQFDRFLNAQVSGHENTATLLQGQTKQLKENAERGKADAQAKRIPACDGSSTKRLRQWFNLIDLTIQYTERTLYVASQSSEGPLRLELERFLKGKDRNVVTWEAVKTHLSDTFLSKHEADRLRDEVEKVRQGDYETSAAFGRRFREAADLGYPSNSRNIDQQRTMLGAYLRGLKDKRLVERVVREARPDNFVDAMKSVADYEGDEYRLFRAINGYAPAERNEEPMEVGAVMSANAQAANDITELSRKVNGLSKEFTKLMAVVTKTEKSGYKKEPKNEGRMQYSSQPKGGRSQGQGNGRWGSRPPLKFTQDGLPICLVCDQPGHIKRDCPQLKRGSRGKFDRSNQGGH